MVDEKQTEQSQPFQGYTPEKIDEVLKNITDPKERAEKKALLGALGSFGKGLDIIANQKNPKA